VGHISDPNHSKLFYPFWLTSGIKKKKNPKKSKKPFYRDSDLILQTLKFNHKIVECYCSQYSPALRQGSSIMTAGYDLKSHKIHEISYGNQETTGETKKH
jgi:hypothetical protein